MNTYKLKHTGAEIDGHIDDRQNPHGVTAMQAGAYPVGSVYMSVVATSPAALFGGTWVQQKDRFLVGAGGDIAVKQTGGHYDLQAHSHKIRFNGTNGNFVTIGANSAGGTAVVDVTGWAYKSSSDYLAHQIDTDIAGAGTGGNLPPFFAVYMWYRVA